MSYRSDRQLRNREKNELLTAIVQRGDDPTDFAWGTKLIRTGSVEALEHQPSDFYFAVGITSDGTKYYGECEPGRETQVRAIGGLTWPEMMVEFRTWLRIVQEELTEPDAWAEVEDSRAEFASAMSDEAGGSDAMLTEAERSEVAEFVAVVRENILQAKPDLTAEQLEVMNERLRELAAAGERLTKKDFVNYAIGAVITIGVELTLRSSEMNVLLKTAFYLATRIVRGLPELPPP